MAIGVCLYLVWEPQHEVSGLSWPLAWSLNPGLFHGSGQTWVLKDGTHDPEGSASASGWYWWLWGSIQSAQITPMLVQHHHLDFLKRESVDRQTALE